MTNDESLSTKTHRIRARRSLASLRARARHIATRRRRRKARDNVRHSIVPGAGAHGARGERDGARCVERAQPYARDAVGGMRAWDARCARARRV
jgi:hypothetical protein